MSYIGLYEHVIQEDAEVVLYVSPLNKYSAIARRNHLINTSHGQYDLSTVIGKPYGSKCISVCKNKSVKVLHPTTWDWTNTLSHRTQIVYNIDASFIINGLFLKPGTKVLEAGTGSGSLTHHLAKVVGNEGHVYTFEYHKHRAEMAQKEFTRHNLTNVTVSHGDIMEIDLSAISNITAIFLDLPNPWNAITPQLLEVCDKNLEARVCTFSPCAEQVQKTYKILKDNKFADIVTYEVLNHEYHLKALKDGKKVLHPISEVYGHTSYLTFASLWP